MWRQTQHSARQRALISILGCTLGLALTACDNEPSVAVDNGDAGVMSSGVMAGDAGEGGEGPEGAFWNPGGAEGGGGGEPAGQEGGGGSGGTEAGSSAGVPGPVDSDQDGTPDELDAFPMDPSEWSDADGDGVGDNADLDDDNDGLSDLEEEAFAEDCRLSSPTRADTDGDGILDPSDPYPRDPFPEFMLRARADGMIDLFLSERDGTFREPVMVGEPVEHAGETLSYATFEIADFDDDGVMDFIASSTIIPGTTSDRYIFLFTRDAKADEFRRHTIGVNDGAIKGVAADVNGDHSFDVVVSRIDRPQSSNITGGRLITYLNNHQPRATCVASPNPMDGCFFVLASTVDVSEVVADQWGSRFAAQAVNLTPALDEHVDIAFATYSSGGNSATRVYVLEGDGEGGFSAPNFRFTHNETGQQAPVNTMLFSDFNGDQIGDVLMGFDDDGRPGEAWTYFGLGDGSFNTASISAVDINPEDDTEQGGGENLGRESSGRTFDLDFDGKMDLIIGVSVTRYGEPGETRVYLGQGDGTFGPDYTVIGERSQAYGSFAIPSPRCTAFSF